VQRAGRGLALRERRERRIVVVDDGLHAVDHVHGGGASRLVPAVALGVRQRGGHGVDDGHEIAERDERVGGLGQHHLDARRRLQHVVAQRLELLGDRGELREQLLGRRRPAGPHVRGRAGRARPELGEARLERGDASAQVIEAAGGGRRGRHSDVTRSTSSSVVTPVLSFSSADSRSVSMPWSRAIWQISVGGAFRSTQSLISRVMGRIS